MRKEVEAGFPLWDRLFACGNLRSDGMELFNDTLMAMGDKLNACDCTLPPSQQSRHHMGKAGAKVWDGDVRPLERRLAAHDDAMGMGMIVETAQAPAKTLMKRRNLSTHFFQNIDIPKTVFIYGLMHY